MVLIKHSSLVAAASGKIGSTIFSRNKSGVSVRGYRRGTKSTSPKATGRRTFLRWLGVLWRTSMHFMLSSPINSNWNFDSIPVHWEMVDCTFIQFDSRGTFTTLPFKSASRSRNRFYPVVGQLCFCTFSFNTPLSTVNGDANVYIYDQVHSYTLLNYSFAPSGPSYVASFFFITTSVHMSVNVRLSGQASIAVWDYCAIQPATDVFKLSWNQAAKNFPYSDRLGTLSTLSGQQLFTKLNFNMLELGIDPVTTAPVQSDLLGVSIASSTISPTVFQVHFNESVLPANTAILIYCTRTFPKSVTSWKPQEMKLLRPTPALIGSIVDCFSQFEQTFGSGSLISDGHVFLKVSSFDTRSGQRVKSVVQSLNIGD